MRSDKYLSGIDLSKITTREQLQSAMVVSGYNFNLCGTRYIFELFASSEIITKIPGTKSPNVSLLASKYNIKPKSMNRDMRWAYQRREKYKQLMKELAEHNLRPLEKKEDITIKE